MSTNEPPVTPGEPTPALDRANGNHGSPVPNEKALNKKALWSMIVGITSLVVGLYIGLMIFGSVVAVALGVVARGEIKRSAGTQTGSGQALTGIITGLIFLGIFVLLTIAIQTGLVDVPADLEP